MSLWLRRWDLNLMTFGLWARRATDCSTPRYNWCRKPGSNRYEKKSHGILSPGRLPIPPFRHMRPCVPTHCLSIISPDILNVKPFLWKTQKSFIKTLTIKTTCDIIYKVILQDKYMLFFRKYTVIDMSEAILKIELHLLCSKPHHIRRLISATAECCEAVTTRRSWKFVGQADDKKPKPLENTDYFGTPKIAKTRTSNVISNTFQNHNLIRRNIEAVTTRRSWKPFAQKARGFESLFLRQKIRTLLVGVLYFLPQSEGTNPKGSHTADTEQIPRNRLFAVSASRGDVGLNLYWSGTVNTILTPSSISLSLRHKNKHHPSWMVLIFIS